MTNEEHKLENCPFCGKADTLRLTTAEELANEGEDDPAPWEHSPSWTVICDAARPRGPGGCGASGGFMPSEEEAIAAWNRRAHLQQRPLPVSEAGVLVLLKRPEGYEDVHPELLVADAHIHPGFEPEIVARPLPVREGTQCSNCGKPDACITDGDPEGEVYCSQECYDQHDELGCPHELHHGYRHPVESARLIAAEDALRSLACWLGVGGYNAPTVDAKVFEEKIRDGVTTYLPLHGMAARDLAELVLSMGMVTDKGIRSRELARRVLGIVPLASPSLPAIEEPTWQPIETAPKDGAPIIVARHMSEFGWIRGWATWQGEGYVAGWVSRGFDDVLSNLGLAHPTHWMPLPASPSAQNRGEGE